jgi:hypothetical protein
MKSSTKNILKIYLKEVVEQISEEHCQKLVEAVQSGDRNAVLVIGENSRGKYNKVAFSSFTVPHAEWKLYYPAQMEVVSLSLPTTTPDGAVN